MGKFLKRSFTLVALVVFYASNAALSPVGLALIPPLQFPASSANITGARASILWGNHRAVYGADLGVVGNITSTRFGGSAIAGIFNNNRSLATIVGGQVAGITNVNQGQTTILGLQLAGAVNSNSAETSVLGAQVAILANLSPHTLVRGAQVALYNTARTVYGVQVGLVNVADVLHGLQIGLYNINRQGLFKACPIINFGF